MLQTQKIYAPQATQIARVFTGILRMSTTLIAKGRSPEHKFVLPAIATESHGGSNSQAPTACHHKQSVGRDLDSTSTQLVAWCTHAHGPLLLAIRQRVHRPSNTDRQLIVGGDRSDGTVAVGVLGRDELAGAVRELQFLPTDKRQRQLLEACLCEF